MTLLEENLRTYGICSRTSKYLYATCEPFSRYRHGYDNNSTYNMEEFQFILYAHYSFTGLTLATYWLKNRNERHMRVFGVESSAKLHLIEPIILPGGELAAILKTFWISILQKKWRRFYNERKRKITKYLQLRNLQKREIGIN